MATSLIAVTALASVSVVGGYNLLISYQAPAGQGCRSYMQPAKFEIWESLTNNRNAAVKIVDVILPFYPRTGLTNTNTRYVWVRAVDPAGNVGNWYPPSASGGWSVAATLAPVQPVVDALQLDYNTKITNEVNERKTDTSAIATRTSALEASATNPTTGFVALAAKVSTEEAARVAGDSSLASQITEVSAVANGSSANGRIKFVANAGPGAAASNFQLAVQATVGGATTFAGMEVKSSGVIDFKAALLRILDAGNSPRFVFDSATGQLSLGMLKAGAIETSSLLVNGVVITEKVAGNAISGGASSALSGVRILTSSAQVVAGPVPASNTGQSGSRNLVIAVADYRTIGNDSAYFGQAEVKLFGNGAELQVKGFLIDDNFAASVCFIYVHDNPPANVNYEMTALIAGGGGGGCLLDQCKIVSLPFKK